MTVEDITPRIVYAASGTEYTFNFIFQENSDIVVNLVVNATGVATLQVEGVDYTLVNSDPGGIVTFLSAPAATNDVVITRAVAVTQPTNLPTFGPVATSLFEDLADRVTLLVQDLKHFAENYTVQIPSGFNEAMVLPAPVAGEVLQWNDTEDGLENIDAETLTAALLAAMNPNTPLTTVNTVYVTLQTGNNYLAPLPNDTRTAAQWIAAYPNITSIVRLRNGSYTYYPSSTIIMAYTPTDANNQFMITCSAPQIVSYPVAPFTVLTGRTVNLGDTYARLKPRIQTLNAPAALVVDKAYYDAIYAGSIADNISISTTGTNLVSERFTLVLSSLSVARDITFVGDFRSLGAALPTVTTASKVTVVEFLFDGSFWACMSVNTYP